MGQKNRLADETSPYLLQHADNPVDWFPWGEVAFERARAEGKPILLSIGYSACHWCHVMAHESFEDDAIAGVMNELFVNIKVDREERPDIDKIYQTAHQLLTQRGGGWPLTVFIDPQDQLPFFAGTYFPSQPRHGMPAFTEVMQRVSLFFKEHRDDIAEQKEPLRDVFRRIDATDSTSSALDERPLQAIREQLEQLFDARRGGFGAAPKFPHPASIERLLEHWAQSREDETDAHALHMASFTLDKMIKGGLYDQVGGGFYRYSVDAEWMIPHFEKMLYDNGPLLGVCTGMARATGSDVFSRAARETADWMIREMQSPEGGYYSTLDADSEGVEGKYYVWTPEEVRSVVNDDVYDAIAPYFGLDGPANFEGKHHHLHVVSDQTIDHDVLDQARCKLFGEREKRIRPGRDEKILTSWNAMAIRGMAIASRELSMPALHESADRALRFLNQTLWIDPLSAGPGNKSSGSKAKDKATARRDSESASQSTTANVGDDAAAVHDSHHSRDGYKVDDSRRLFATYKDGRVRFAGYLDDHAHLADAIIEILQCRWHSADLQWATTLADHLLRHFEDKQNGGFFFTADDHEELFHRTRSFSDDATPNGNGTATRALIRLGYLLGENRYLDAAERALRAAWEGMNNSPSAHATMISALAEFIDPPQIVVLRGSSDEMSARRAELQQEYRPNRLIFSIDSAVEDLPAELAMRAPRGKLAMYVCRGHTCELVE